MTASAPVRDTSGMKMTRTLYVSDLDGTLLTPQGTVSSRTGQLVRKVVVGGALFTCATSRSWTTTARLVLPLDLRLPAILHNGAVIYDHLSRMVIAAHKLSPQVVDRLLVLCRDLCAAPLVHTLDDGHERTSWLPDRSSDAIHDFWTDRPDDPRNTPRTAWEDLPIVDVLGVALIGEAQAIAKVRDAVGAEMGPDCRLGVRRDTYRPGWSWMEAVHPAASKGQAVTYLAQRYHARRIVVFGDHLNDLDLFAVADEAYAVANADPVVIAAADGVIASNDADGVAEWLARHAMPAPTQ